MKLGKLSKGTIINNIKEGISYIFEKLGEIVATIILTTLYEDYGKHPTFWTENSSYLVIRRLTTIKYLRNQGIDREFSQAI